jgi:hypothetical protein
LIIAVDPRRELVMLRRAMPAMNTPELTDPGLLRSFFWVAALLVALAGCSQDAGQACQVDGDCASGLKCDAEARKNERGRCVDPKAKVDSGTDQTDSGQPPQKPDSALDSGGSDAAGSEGDAG